MNNQMKDVLKYIFKNKNTNQRMIAEATGHSLGGVNKCIKELIDEEYIDRDLNILTKAKEMIDNGRPKNAIILAAGFGMRMVPINMEVSKGMLEVNGEPLIERTIKQIKESGIDKIYIVVGFMKEQYEYLIDKYDVELVVNAEYASKNNLYSVNKVLDKLSDSYIVPCDIWCKDNPYDDIELYSWYMVKETKDIESTVGINRKKELVPVKDDEQGNAMIGISYITAEDAAFVKDEITRLCMDEKNDDKFWEEAFFTEKMKVAAKIVKDDAAIEINTYEQLRKLDGESSSLKAKALEIIAKAINVKLNDIKNIEVLKKGMTNSSFIFECRNKKYIMRMPGPGSNKLINRKQEAAVYNVIQGKDISDKIVFIDSDNGYKITEYIEDVRTCDPYNVDDISKCMRKLRDFHRLKLKVEHEFDIFKNLEFYENLWDGKPSVYRDYEETKEKIYELKSYIDNHIEEKILCHIDANCDNFLFSNKTDGTEMITLIDWEYAGMQDPDIDIAMFGIYAMYDRENMDRLIDIYFDNKCKAETRIKIYCYIATCGLLWSNWCEYKRNQGVDFGEYSLRQYRYAKEYYKIVKKEVENR